MKFNELEIYILNKEVGILVLKHIKLYVIMVQCGYNENT